MWPKVSIVILNWNGLKDTVECLESLKKIVYPNYNIIVVDNGSTGNDAEALKSQFGDYIYLIRNDKNLGFAGGTNIGIEHSLANFQPDYILSLNNDTVVDPQFLSYLVEAVQMDTSIGIAAPKVYYYDHPDHIQCFGSRLSMTRGQGFFIGDGKVDGPEFSQQREVDYVGACVLISINVIRDIGLFDESYFCYWEDVDYCLRASEAGYKVVCNPLSQIWHKMYMKKHLLDKPPHADKRRDSVTYYWIRNAIRFMHKHARIKQRVIYYIFFFGCHFWLLSGAYLLLYRDQRRFIGLCYGIRDGFLGKSGSYN